MKTESTKDGNGNTVRIESVSGGNFTSVSVRDSSGKLVSSSTKVSEMEQRDLFRKLTK